MKHLTRALWAMVPAAIVAAIVVPMALIERNCWGIGGEWLLVVLTFVAVLYRMEVRHGNV